MPPIFTDQLGHNIEISKVPNRVISLVPSQTELLCDLGLRDRLAGRTKFCIHPKDHLKFVPDVGGTKTLKLSKIRELQPDLIIANKEENKKSHIEVLRKDFPVWTSDVKNLNNAKEMILRLAGIFGCKKQGETMTREISAKMKMLRYQTAFHGKAAYLIWYRPWMTVGGDTFIHNMMELAGFQNVYSEKLRYPVLEIKDLSLVNPDFILLSSEPFPFKEKHKAEILKILPDSEIIFVDGEAFLWYGSRLLKSLPYLSQLTRIISR